MATPASRTELIEYCLRKLGKPVLEINVDQRQLEDRIDDALQYYRDYHPDSMIRMYKKHQVTATDIANEYITLPEEILYVSKVLPINSTNSIGGWFGVEYQLHLQDVYGFNSSSGDDLVNYELAQQYLSLVNLKLGGATSSRFNRHMNRLYIDIEWDADIKEDDYIVVEVYEAINENTFTDIFNDRFLKRYATELIRMQWGQNLSKFSGIQLLGGVTVDGQVIMERAREAIEKLEEEMLNTTEPIDFFIG